MREVTCASRASPSRGARRSARTLPVSSRLCRVPAGRRSTKRSLPMDWGEEKEAAVRESTSKSNKRDSRARKISSGVSA